MSRDDFEPPDFSRKMKKLKKGKEAEGFQETPERRKKRLLLLVRSGVFYFFEELVREQKNLGVTDDEVKENVFVGIEMRKHKIHELNNPNPVFVKAAEEYTKLEERLEQLSPQEILKETQKIMKLSPPPKNK
jgi:predicted nuclease with TOPRIM domain